jgi:glucose-6-phosphate 1-dehydrogenase
VFSEITRGHSNRIKFRIGDEMSISVSAKVYDPDMRQGEDVELYAQRKKTVSVPPYERLLTDAMSGNRMLFSDQQAVDAMWRIVDPILDDVVPVHTYKQGTWGPVEADRMVNHYGQWRNPE